MLLESIIRQNVPRQFPPRKPEYDAVGSLSGTVSSDRTKVGRSLAELHMQYGDTLATAPLRETTSVADLRKLREEEHDADEPITEHAFKTARDLLRYVPLGTFERVPEPFLTADG